MRDYKLDNGIVIQVPDNVLELKLDTYLDILEAKDRGVFENMNEYELSFYLMKTYIDYPIDDISINEFNGLISIINGIDLFSVNEIKNINHHFNINGVDYTCRKSFDELTFGEVFYIKQMIITLKEFEYIPRLIAALYRPSKKRQISEFRLDEWEQDEFDVEWIELRKQLFLNKKIGDVWGVITGYFEWELNLQNRFENLYKRKPEGKGPTLETIKIHPKWAMISMLESLTGQDITKNDLVFKTNYIECLTILSCRDIQDDYYNKINKHNGK